MNQNEYMAALRRALSGLPDEELANALRYYEEYFEDAGPENVQKVIADLGSPESVAAQILSDYRELTALPHTQQNAGAGGSQTAAPKRRWRGINPWLLLVLVLLAIPIGIPLAAAFAAVLVAVLAVIASVILVVIVVAVVVPVCLLCGGGAFVLFSFFVWGHPASAVLTLGCGLVALALGVLASLFMIKLCILFIPPIFRGFVAVLRWPIDKIRGVKS